MASCSSSASGSPNARSRVLNELASKYGVATDYYGVTHPSLPNYLAAFAGTSEGIFDDCKAGADVTCAPEEFVPDSGDDTSAAALTPEETATASGDAAHVRRAQPRRRA